MILEKIKSILGAGGFLTEPADIEGYLTSWRGGSKGEALGVALPSTTAQVSEIVKICAAEKIPIVPQSGNTGLVMGSISKKNELLINLSRLNKIRKFDAENQNITVEAGYVLEKLHGAVEEKGFIFPLHMASAGSAEIGGIVSTNAGGTAVVKYGNMRNLTLGLEVVLPDGQILNKLSYVKKDNTGYDLNQLFIGAEGTLGIITAANLKLFPIPKTKIVAFLGIEEIKAAPDLLKIFQAKFENNLSAFEFISNNALGVVLKEITGSRLPLAATYPYYILLEISSSTEESLQEKLTDILGKSMESGLIGDAAIAESIAQAKDFWNLREHISEAARKSGKGIHFDISVPIANIPEFIFSTTKAAKEKFPEIFALPFGHIGDGNIHYNFLLPRDMEEGKFAALKKDLKKLVYEAVIKSAGSISAEHGIGLERKEDLLLYKSPLEIDLMRKIKNSLDPHNIMNPGKIF